MAKLPGMATVAGELADRAEALTTEGPDGQGVVGGKNAIMYLTEQLNLLWAYRNWLVIAHNLVTRAVAAANEQIAKAKPGKGKTKMKEARNLANTKLTEIGSALTDVQGTVVGANPFGYMKTLPSAPGMFGGSDLRCADAAKGWAERSELTRKDQPDRGPTEGAQLSQLARGQVQPKPVCGLLRRRWGARCRTVGNRRRTRPRGCGGPCSDLTSRGRHQRPGLHWRPRADRHRPG